ncbi:tetratricopeptide repeat protein [Cryomorphaceae bacterium]|nr:tetratricopeptide repeat protein [Cryomorphaceae bacterium]
MAKKSAAKGRKKKQGSASEPKKSLPLGPLVGLPILIIALTWIAYSGIGEYDWVNFDDPPYVYENGYVVGGQFSEVWKPRSFVMGNYHPLTMWTLARDWAQNPNDPGAFHRSNVFYHILAALFVYFFFWRLTGSWFIGGFTGLVFAVHPMHVESVAWVAARKDQLMALFFFAALLSYLYYLEDQKRRWIWYGLTLVLFLGSMMSKAMAAPFPVVLLLVDFYRGRSFKLPTWLEKLPFFAVSFVLGYWAIIAQRSADALTMESFPLSEKIFFAGNSTILYLVKFLAPFKLSVFYPYPEGGVPFTFYLTTLLAVALGIGAIVTARKTKVFLFGFGFFILMVALVLQLLSVGAAMMADRYTYIPYVGLAFMLGVGLERINALRPRVGWVLGGVMVLAFTGLTRDRVPAWENTVTLFTDVIEKYPNVPVAYNNRGKYYGFQEQDYERAFADLNKSVEVDPEYPNAYVNRGNVYSMRKEYQKAMKDYDRALELRPTYYDALTNRAITNALLGNYESSLADYGRALEIQPNNAQIYFNRGYTYFQMRDWDASYTDYNKALQLNPSNGQAYYYRSMVESQRGNLDAARRDVRTARARGFAVPDSYARQLGL